MNWKPKNYNLSLLGIHKDSTHIQLRIENV